MRYLLLLLLSLPVKGALWFVDKDATGNNTGVNWPNAWNSFNAIVWSSIQPGDTIYISGGPNGKNYTSPLIVGKNGTSTNQPITIAVHPTDSAHNGVVNFQSTYLSTEGRQYIVVSGNVNGQQRMRFSDFWNSSIGTFANAILSPSSLRVKFDSILWTNVNNCVDARDSAGLWITNCAGLQTRGDACVRGGGLFGFQWDANIIERSVFETVIGTGTDGNMAGPDGIQTGNNLTVRNNIFSVRKMDYLSPDQHNDMCQAPGVYLKFYNNEFINSGDCGIMLSAWWNGSVHDHIWIFNNVFHNVVGIDPFPEFFRIYNNIGNIASFSDVLIANNTFIDNITANGYGRVGLYIPWAANGSAVGTLSNVKIANNIFVNCPPYYITDNSALNGGGMTFSHNVYYSGAQSFYRGTTYNSAAAWKAAIEPTATVGTPTFVSYSPNNPNNDYHLHTNDTVALNAENLSAYFTFDKDGNTRNSWTAGAYGTGSAVPPTPPSDPPASPLHIRVGTLILK